MEGILPTLQACGAVTISNLEATEQLENCRQAVYEVVDAVRAAVQDSHLDHLKAFDNVWLPAKFGVTRMAKIGRGKKNIHFDPFGSKAHDAMAKLIEESCVLGLIRQYCGEESSVNETGISLTLPGGDGLEWHADGRIGECTVIMSLEDIEEKAGRLGVLPSSHTKIDRAVVDDFDSEAEKLIDQEKDRVVWYAYRAGQPIIFDARLLHMAEGSQEKEDGEWRLILWWIVNQNQQ